MPNTTARPLCYDCGYRQAHNSTSRYCVECRTLCPDCHEEFDHNRVRNCQSCYESCPRCSRARRSTRFVEHEEYGRVCDRCNDGAHRCHQCNEWGHIDQGEINQAYDDGLWYHTDHMEMCDDCGVYVIDMDAHDEACTGGRNGYRGVRGYGHTHPEMWLGGPLPRNERGQQIGYYLGFELEISADRSDNARKIKRWSEENLGVNIFDCKSDSSVAGFEIATQPMTPEYFEKIPWESFFEMLNANFSRHSGWSDGYDEPDSHGLHVHIGRVAFRNDVNIAAYSYLLAQGGHLERIGRRQATGYCPKVEKPVSAAIAVSQGNSKQKAKIQGTGYYSGRNAINLSNSSTIEIRAGKSTRSAQNLRNTIRVVYVAAEYIRYLMAQGDKPRPKALHWSEFARWTSENYPFAFASIANLDEKVPADKVDFGVLDKTLNTVF